MSAGCEVAPRGWFIAGTDTEVGKTYVATALVRQLVRRGLRVAAMKPVAAGAHATPAGLRNTDALALATAANVTAAYATLNPYCLASAVSPHIAAAEAGVRIDTAHVARCFRTLVHDADRVVVEGAGGWLAPIGADSTMADIAGALGLPVLLVVGLRLGCINHALLSARAIASSGLALAGWVGNRIDPRFERAAENLATLEHWLGRPPAAVLPWRAQAEDHVSFCLE